jgi:hypothetical protein
MNDLEHFEICEGYASFRPVGRVTWKTALELFEQAMGACSENCVTRLLVSTALLTHTPLTLAERYFLGEGLARRWDRSIRLSVVARADQIDPDRFGWRVARNRGLDFGLYEIEAEAIRWLFEAVEEQANPLDGDDRKRLLSPLVDQ